MRKNKVMCYAALGVVFILFNVIAFVIPTAKTSTFWIAYVFTVIAFVLQIGVWIYAFKGSDKIKSKFLGIPLVAVGIIYLIIQIIAFSVFMAYPLTQMWIAVVVCAFILGISAIFLIGTEVGKNEINRVEPKIEKKVFYIKSLQTDVEMIAENEIDEDMRELLKQLAEKIRFSDPMSNNELIDIEIEINSKIAELKITDKKTESVKEIETLLTERNKKVKLLKGE
ncbi:MAG: hypothetical protein IJZ35_07610 [Clostridia bacterium]|nr:hypothetical protein [Clostridia bacterium]